MRLSAVAFALLLVVTGACQRSAEEPPNDPLSASTIIDSAIVAHGGPVLDRAEVTFTFRGDHFRLRHDEGRFHYQRTATDSLGRTIEEGLTNDSLYRRVDGKSVALSEDEREALDTRVNSVAYFALLPYRLRDPAVISRYSGRDTIDGVPYHRLRVTFQQEGGGRDWEDVFMYWFRTDTYTMDYLAYAFGLGPEEEPGTRFREAYNVRDINGVRVADYYNYTADPFSPDQLHRYPDRWANEKLDLVSRVELDSVQVQPLTNGS